MQPIRVSTQTQCDDLIQQGYQITHKSPATLNGRDVTKITLKLDPSSTEECTDTATRTTAYVFTAPFVAAGTFAASAVGCTLACIVACASGIEYEEARNGSYRFGTALNPDGTTRLIDNQPTVEAIGRDNWQSQQQQFGNAGEQLLECSAQIWNQNEELYKHLKPCQGGVLEPEIVTLYVKTELPAPTALETPEFEEGSSEEE